MTLLDVWTRLQNDLNARKPQIEEGWSRDADAQARARAERSSRALCLNGLNLQSWRGVSLAAVLVLSELLCLWVRLMNKLAAEYVAGHTSAHVYPTCVCISYKYMFRKV